jgi:hypothetical protein
MRARRTQQGSYSHPLFVRDNADLYNTITISPRNEIDSEAYRATQKRHYQSEQGKKKRAEDS